MAHKRKARKEDAEDTFSDRKKKSRCELDEDEGEAVCHILDGFLVSDVCRIVYAYWESQGITIFQEDRRVDNVDSVFPLEFCLDWMKNQLGWFKIPDFFAQDVFLKNEDDCEIRQRMYRKFQQVQLKGMDLFALDLSNRRTEDDYVASHWLYVDQSEDALWFFVSVGSMCWRILLPPNVKLVEGAACAVQGDTLYVAFTDDESVYLGTMNWETHGEGCIWFVRLWSEMGITRDDWNKYPSSHDLGIDLVAESMVLLLYGENSDDDDTEAETSGKIPNPGGVIQIKIYDIPFSVMKTRIKPKCRIVNHTVSQ